MRNLKDEALHSWREDVCADCVYKEDLVGCSGGVINFVAMER